MAPSPPAPARLQIGDWQFDTGSHELVRAGTRERLPRRLGRLLERLAAEPGRVVSHETLLAEVWERGHVAPEVLARAVAELRRALGDEPRAPRYIETIPKRGYRLVATVAPDHEAPATIDDPIAVAIGSRRPWRRALAALLAVLAAAVTVWLLRQPATVAPSVAGNPLAQVRPFTSAPGYELSPALSPDGQLLAFAEYRGEESTSAIVVQGVDGAGHRRFDEVTDASDLRPRFSPDGRKLAFLRRAPGRCEVRVRPLLAGESRRVADCAAGVPSSVDWSPDGARLAFTAPVASDGATGPGIALVTLADGAITPLPLPPVARGADTDPRFSPDGRQLAFARGEDSDRDLLLLDLDRPERPRVLSTEPSRILGLAWSPDAQSLVVGSDQAGYRTLMQVELASGEWSTLAAREGQFPDVARSGELAYELAHYDANLWRRDLRDPDGAAVRVVHSTRYDGTPTLSPDASRFVFVSTREDQETVWLRDAGREDDQRLALDPARRWVFPAWSPDGKALLLTRYEGLHTTVHRHELASARTTELTALGQQAFGAQYARDGAEIVYGVRVEPASMSLWRIAATLDAAPTPLVTDEPVVRFNADGQRVVYQRGDLPGLVVLSLIDGARTQVLPRIGAEQRWIWRLVGDALWYVDESGDVATLHRLDLATGNDIAVATGVEPDAVAPALDVARDGSVALFARVDEVSIDVMLAPRAFEAARR
jgi:Tol biopolymer transport system component/DNA-binding winged helix-turn-helix (wHTH) protein